MEKIQVANIQEVELAEGLNVLVESFMNEAMTSYIYDFSKANTKELFYLSAVLKAKVYMEVGHDILVASLNSRIVGIAIIKKDVKIPIVKGFRMVFPDILKAIPLSTKVNWKKIWKLRKAIKHTQTLKKPYLTLEALAVHPNYQGKGIGKALIDKVHRIADAEATGIYLFTADRRNQQIYEYLDYETVEENQGGELTVYHMFRKNGLR